MPFCAQEKLAGEILTGFRMFPTLSENFMKSTSAKTKMGCHRQVKYDFSEIYTNYNIHPMIVRTLWDELLFIFLRFENNDL